MKTLTTIIVDDEAHFLVSCAGVRSVPEPEIIMFSKEVFRPWITTTTTYALCNVYNNNWFFLS